MRGVDRLSLFSPRHPSLTQPTPLRGASALVSHTTIQLLRPFELKEALRCILHTIIFGRSLGPVEPLEVQSELFDVTYVRNGTIRADKTVELAIEKFTTSMKFFNNGTSKGQIVLSFFEKQKTTSFFGTERDEKVQWERWVIPVIVQTSNGRRPPREDSPRRGRRSEEALRDCMIDVVSRMNEKTDHLPSANLNKTKPMIFSYEIYHAQNGDADGSWLSRLLQTASPPLVSA